MRQIILWLMIFIVFIPLALSAQEEGYTDIAELAEQCGCGIRIDYWKGIFELKKGHSTVRFSVDADWYLINMNEIHFGAEAKLTEDGRFYIDETSAADIVLFFSDSGTSGARIQYIVIDPGHGGKDPGAIGYFNSGGEKRSLQEKDVVLNKAIETARMLSARFPDKEIILTRNDDRYLKLEERTEIANSIDLKDNESMIFVSIHANASFNTTARGFEVWYLPPEYRRDLIDPESMKEVDSDVIPILNTMLEEEYTVESVILGDKLLKSLDEQVGDISINRGPKEESWFVVRNARMPSVLIELGFVTNQ